MKTMERVDEQQPKTEVVGSDHRHLYEGKHRILFVGAAILLMGAVCAAPFAFLGSYILAVSAWLVLLGTFKNSLRAGTILLLLILLRLPLSFHPPRLSPDVYRYRWDGRVALAGHSPYRYPPADSRLTALRDESFTRIEHREIRSVYPPWAQLLFLAWAALGGDVLVWRVILLVAEVATVLLLRRWSMAAAFAYATCPLAVIEGFWNGHVDVVAATFVTAALVLTAPFWSGASLGIAAGIKLVPIVALPALWSAAAMPPLSFRTTKSGGMAAALQKVLLGFLVATAIPVTGYLMTNGIMTGLPEYARRWSFNSPLFIGARRAIEAVRLDQGLKQLWSAVKGPLGLESVAAAVYNNFYPDFLARMFLAIIFVVGLVIIMRRSRSVVSATTDGIGLLILCSPTIHPWYWLTLLPPAIVSGRTFWIALAIASPMSYLIYDRSPVLGMIGSYAPAVALMVLQVSSGFRARDISRWIASRGDAPS